MDLDLSAVERVPGRGAGVAARARPRRRRCRRWRPRRGSPRTAPGSASCARPACRWCPGREEYGGRAATPLRVAGLRGGVLRGRRARRGSARTASTCWPRPCSGTAPPSSSPASCRRWPRARRSGRRPGRSRRRAATSPSLRATATQDRRRLAAERAEDVELARGLRRPGVRPVPHRSGVAAAPRPDLPDVRAGRRRASPCRPIGRLDGKPAFAELFLDDVFVPDARRHRRGPARAGGSR